ncbi:15205_t:CDS:2 [Cetraspora pellucida]|uniref:15205_t:CDS:1 n=1 Tax=Cetraspora pellucida TaxID=1433469 RepID=A0A9N9F4I9_9GLOM|nr:15205_t:CDS:2 [Cetraspora pellucida]
MILAMNKTTKTDCEETIWNAINTCPVPDIVHYLNRNYIKNMKKWALWACQHSSILLQVTTTNPLESYHSELKRITSKQHEFISACNKIIKLDYKKELDSEKTAINFFQKCISIFDFNDETIEQIHKFPYPIQKLMTSEITAMNKRVEKRKLLPNLIAPKCTCLFFCRYLVPCKHIFHQHLFGQASNKLLTINIWKRLQDMFVKEGIAIYEGNKITKILVPVQTLEEKEMKARRLHIGEIMEKIYDRYRTTEKKSNENIATEFIKRLDMLLSQILNKYTITEI